MYILAVIFCIIITILIAKFDKKKCIKLDEGEFVIEKPSKYSGWIDYYKGRVNIYKILIVCSLIPWINYFLLFISTVIIVLFILYYIINKITNKLF